MDIFKGVVPYVAFWLPNGVEKIFTCDEGEAIETQYGLYLKTTKRGKTRFYPVCHDSSIHEGEKFKSFKLVSFRQYGYRRRKDGSLIKVPVKFRYDGTIFVSWQVTEIYK